MGLGRAAEPFGYVVELLSRGCWWLWVLCLGSVLLFFEATGSLLCQPPEVWHTNLSGCLKVDPFLFVGLSGVGRV